ncbi:MAG TPA: hypothetical protein VIJ39_06935 [Solirubrobacteraceae bacterium]
MTRKIIAFGLIVCALVVTGCGSGNERAYTIHGTFTLISAQLGGEHGCWGAAESGFSDIGAATQVIVKNENGTLIGSGSLGPGRKERQVECLFSFTISGLPKARFYGIAVSHRGEQDESFQDLVKSNWNVNLTLG